MGDLFARDQHRFERFSLKAGDILFDYSKNRVTQETMGLLFDLARQANLPDKIEAMFTGDKYSNVHQRGRGSQGRDRPEEYVRVLGLGEGPLFAMVGHWLLGDRKVRDNNQFFLFCFASDLPHGRARG